MARLHSNAPQARPIAPPHFPQEQDVVSVTIRPTQIGDAADIHDIVTHPAVGFGTNQLLSQELPATIEWLQRQNRGVHRYSAVAQHDNGSSKIVGNLTLHQHQKARLAHAAWFGMSVHPHYWGLGIGSQLVESALDLADNWLGLKRVELEVHTDNLGAIHLYKKFGFTIEGTKRLYNYGAGRWTDAHFMGRLAHNVENS
jgi:putative acetyltransferase